MKVRHGDVLATKQFSKLRIFKNVAVLGISVHLIFTAYDGLTMLQSTMNREQGIGVLSQAVVYICFCLSAVLFPKYVLKKLGSKSTYAFSTLTYLPYVASNFYSHWGLMMPTSILIGLGAALLWGSQAVYLNSISVMYSELLLNNERTNIGEIGSARSSLPRSRNAKERTERSPNYLAIYSNDVNNVQLKSSNNIDTNGYSIPITVTSETDNINQNLDGRVQETEHANYGSFKSIENVYKKENNEKTMNVESTNKQYNAIDRCKIIESITARFFGFHGVAYLSSHITSNLMTYYILQSEIPEGITSNSSCTCGANYCNVESMCFEQNIVEPSDQIRYILTAVCICIGVVSVLMIFIFLDPLETDKEEISFSTDLMMATFNLAKRKELILLVPFSVYIGMVQAFFTGDFNKSFVGCAWGTYHVGLVAVSYGAVSGISALCSGWLVKKMGRIPIFVTVTLVNLAASVFLLMWNPSADEPHNFFIAAGWWGVFVGAILSQLRAFYGALFKADEEAAFAAFHVWYSLGFALSFAYSNYICTYVKLYILIVFCILGFGGYLSVEILHLKNKSKI